MSWLLGVAVAGGVLLVLLVVDLAARRRRQRRRTRQRATRIARLRTVGGASGLTGDPSPEASPRPVIDPERKDSP